MTCSRPARAPSRPLRALVAAVVLAHGSLVHAQDTPAVTPFVFDARNKTLDNGTRYSMTLTEVWRDESASLMALSVDHGSMAAMQIVLFQGVCALMRARGRDRAELIRSESTDTRMKIAFPALLTAADERDPARMIFTPTVCLMVQERPR